MNTVTGRNHVTTPAIVLDLSMAGYVATAPDPADARNAEAVACPKCRRVGLRCRGFENAAGSYRILLSCEGEGCRWAAEA